MVGWWSVIQAPRGGHRLAGGGNRGLRLIPELLGGGRRVGWGWCREEEPTGGWWLPHKEIIQGEVRPCGRRSICWCKEVESKHREE